MTKRRVIVAGAGTSAEFGLPSGEGIFDLLATMPGPPEVESWNDNSLMSNFYSFAGKFDAAARGEATKCIAEIRSNGAGSIDLFAYHRSDYERVAKLMSAWALFNKMDAAQKRCVQRRFLVDVRNRQGAVQDRNTVTNWLSRVFREYAGTARTYDELEPESLTFITFNYDRLIERGLSGFIRSSWPKAPDQALPRVIHVHGAFDAPEDFRPADIASQAANIRFLLETRSEPGPEIAAARTALRQADDIFCAGFAFDPLNVELLGLGEFSPRIFALNYDGHAGLNAYLAELGVSQKKVWQPRAGERMSVGNAADQGFFSQSNSNSFWDDPPRYR